MPYVKIQMKVYDETGRRVAVCEVQTRMSVLDAETYVSKECARLAAAPYQEKPNENRDFRGGPSLSS